MNKELVEKASNIGSIMQEFLVLIPYWLNIMLYF
jgi:hypothetical protein